MRAAGAVVTTVAAYRRRVPDLTPALAAQLSGLLERLRLDRHQFGGAARPVALLGQLGGAAAVAKMQQQHLIVPHARIAETAASLGLHAARHPDGIRRRQPACRVTITSMNELPTLRTEIPAASTVPAAAPVHATFGDVLQLPLVKVAIVLLLLLAALAWSTHSRFGRLRTEMARSLQKSEASANETVALARQVQEQTKELQVKVAALESRQSEAQSQQLALEQLYQDLSKNRDEWALAEIEQVLSTASQQLQLAGNVQGALIALANADRSLSRNDKPQFITIRRAIARDTDKLKALPGIDVAGLALRIDNVITLIDSLPMLSDAKPVAPSELAKIARRGRPRRRAGAAC